MVLFNEFTQFIVIAVYIGLTGLWGNLLSKTRLEGWSQACIFGVFFVLPATIFLPVGLIWRLCGWIIGAVMVYLFRNHPKWLPAYLRTRDFIQIYYGIVMFLVFCWTIVGRQQLPLLWVGLPAGAAGLSGMVSSFQNQAVFKRS